MFKSQYWSAPMSIDASTGTDHYAHTWPFTRQPFPVCTTNTTHPLPANAHCPSPSSPSSPIAIIRHGQQIFNPHILIIKKLQVQTSPLLTRLHTTTLSAQTPSSAKANLMHSQRRHSSSHASRAPSVVSISLLTTLRSRLERRNPPPELHPTHVSRRLDAACHNVYTYNTTRSVHLYPQLTSLISTVPPDNRLDKSQSLHVAICPKSGHYQNPATLHIVHSIRSACLSRHAPPPFLAP